MTLKAKRCLFIAFGLLVHFCNYAQLTPPVVSSDTTRTVQIVRSDFYREKKLDSVRKLQMLAGNVIVREGTTTFSTDSAVINRSSNTVDAYGRVHINEADSIHTFAKYLKYVGNERIAYLRKNVTLTDRTGRLTTDELIYNLASGIGTYKTGGRIVNKGTVLTSKEGTYFSDTKDVFFRKNVQLKDPKYDIKADSLQYNTLTEVVNFTGPTLIKSKDAEIYTTSGYYDLKQGKAYFGNNPKIKDSSGRKYSAINVAIDEKTNVAQLEGNAVIIDSANGFTLTGGQIFLNNKNNSFLATRKPVLIIQQENDSTFIAADTLFSGVRERTIIKPPQIDTARLRQDNLEIARLRDSLRNNRDSTELRQWPPMTDSIRTDTLKLKKEPLPIDSSRLDTLKRTRIINASDTSIRYFLAFAHVRIFNDSLQAVCDSLSYSGEDSVFRMYKNPVTWSGQNQITGDTLYMFTKNKKAERLYVFENAMVINKAGNEIYNQISGRTLNGYFLNGEIDYVRSRGTPAESVYYIQDKDSAYVGMNRASGSVIDMYFVKKELKRVLFVKDVQGIMHPIRQIPSDQKYLKNFQWLEERRPKNRLELFE